MINHEGGIVTLSNIEFSELNEAYHNLYNVLSDMPVFLSDFFDREEYLLIEKWSAQLAGAEFDPKEYEEEEDTDGRKD